MTTTALDIERDNRECPGSYMEVSFSEIFEGEAVAAICSICGKPVELDLGASEETVGRAIYAPHDRGTQDA